MPRAAYSHAHRSWLRRLALGVGLTVGIVLGATALILHLGEPPAWLGIAAAVAGIAPLAWIFAGGAMFAWRYEGVERAAYARSTSTAFIALMLASGFCGMLEAFVRIEPISAWWFYGLGAGVWTVLGLVHARRMA